MSVIRLKQMRLKGGNSANLAGPGETLVKDSHAIMFFFPVEEFVAAKRRKGGEEFLIPTGDISHMQPMGSLEVFEDVADELALPKPLPAKMQATLTVTTDPGFPIPPTVDVEQAAADAASYVRDEAAVAPGPQDDPTPDAADDTVRMVKINGKIVQRKGEPKADELAALAALKPVKTTMADVADADEGPSDEELEELEELTKPE